MSEKTSIQWCDSTVNPIMGCGGCELFPAPGVILDDLDSVAAAAGLNIESKVLFKELVHEQFAKGAVRAEVKKAVNTTNIWHLRNLFVERVRIVAKKEFDQNIAGDVAATMSAIIRKHITCYAAVLHLNRGASILDAERSPKKGYAPIFENVTGFTDRCVEAAGWKDLLGSTHPDEPWKDGFARMIFVSDMGDSLSRRSDFGFLKREVIGAMKSEKGSSHLWLWLTKRPGSMAALAAEIGGLPSNACAMTTVTGGDPERLKRIDELRSVEASVKGLSIEPLWERIPPEKLDLTGIDWVIVGGESGSGNLTRPFALEWAEELRDHCREKGVAFFLKQLGRNPTRAGQPIKLKDPHGGDWREWEKGLQVREFPSYFHEFRKVEGPVTPFMRPIHKVSPRQERVSGNPAFNLLTKEEKTEFRRLDKIVRKGVAAVFEMGQALSQIKEGQLWRGGYSTWQEYCGSVVGHSRSYVHRIIDAARIAGMVGDVTLPDGNKMSPLSEAQVRPLNRIKKDPERTREAWRKAVRSAGGQPTADQVEAAVVEVLPRESPQEQERSRGERRKCVVNELEEALADASPEVRELLSRLKGLL
ncbi:MAG: DUF5131 family protein [Akkermansiaceae bacterium]|nr:DUF5131 family protein [Akkermansiaceae bacterium]